MTISYLAPTLNGEDVQRLKEEFSERARTFYPVGFLIFCRSQERFEQLSRIVSKETVLEIHRAWLRDDRTLLEDIDRQIHLHLKAQGVPDTEDLLVPFDDEEVQENLLIADVEEILCDDQ